MIPVVWKSYHDSPDRGYWDQAFLDWLFAVELPGGFQFEHRQYAFPPSDEGVVLVTPGHWRDATAINEDLYGRPWALVIITSDEEGLCPFWQIDLPNLSVWKQSPRADLAWYPDRTLPLGWTPGTVERNEERPVKDLDWVFAGQQGFGNRRRDAALRALSRWGGDGRLLITEGFAQGMDRDEYTALMRRARVVPCPSGPQIPDTFRLYEALESGAVPIADATCPRGDFGYWQRAFGRVEFPIVEDWSTVGFVINEWRTTGKRARVLAWWEQAKRDWAWRLHDDIATLAGQGKAPVEERITVLVTTSSIPSHPSLAIIDETIRSIRDRLPKSEIIIAADGLRYEHKDRREAYAAYLEELVWACRRWRAVPYFAEKHVWQAELTRRALALVRSDLVLFVEHDTPLVGDIPFAKIGALVLGDYLHTVRFHHETGIPPEHNWLMEASIAFPHDDLRFVRTRQWSQRPHLMMSDRYRRLLDDHFGPEAYGMIEDRLHGIVETAPWDEYKVAIYRPDGSIKRSTHLDGRAEDPNYAEQMRW